MRHPTVNVGLYSGGAFVSSSTNEDQIQFTYEIMLMQTSVWNGAANKWQWILWPNKQLSPYFLNDTPSSRRPWLFRKE
jgi:hypothetical protein